MSLIATLAIAATLGTTPATQTPVPSPTPIIQIAPKRVPGCTQERFQKRVRKVYAKTKISKRDHAWLYESRACLKNQDKARSYQRKVSAERKDRIAIRTLTPYPGPDGTRWAVPWAIVSCESHGKWSAYNPSGALGPYQLLGHGAPWPVRSKADQRRHHQIASNLWAGGRGASHWVCKG